MFRLVVIILDHKTSFPFTLVNLVVGCNYFRWFRIVYLGWLVPYKEGVFRMFCPWVSFDFVTIVTYYNFSSL